MHRSCILLLLLLLRTTKPCLVEISALIQSANEYEPPTYTQPIKSSATRPVRFWRRLIRK